MSLNIALTQLHPSRLEDFSLRVDLTWLLLADWELFEYEVDEKAE